LPSYVDGEFSVFGDVVPGSNYLFSRGVGKIIAFTEVQDYISGLFRLLRLDPSVSLLQQQEIDQMLLLGEAPQRWKREHHFLPRDSYRDLLGIPTCCGPCHNGSDQFVTFYLSQEYCTILDPL
jgi:hypothetical protein